MKQRIALFDANDKFVLVSDDQHFAFRYLDEVVGTGSSIWANGFTDNQLKTIPLIELLKMTKSRVRNSNE